MKMKALSNVSSKVRRVVVIVACALLLSLVCVEYVTGSESPLESAAEKVKVGSASPAGRRLTHYYQGCNDYNLFDAGGYNCNFFAPYCQNQQQWNNAWGSIANFKDPCGHSPLHACCACGGGNKAGQVAVPICTGTAQPTVPPTAIQPTAPPTLSPFSVLEEQIKAVPANNVETVLYVNESSPWGSLIEIEEGQNVVIVGAGDVPIVLDAGGSTSFFKVNAGGSLGLRNLELVNGHASKYGGAIDSRGTISFLIDCTFRSNSAGDAGGAIFLGESKSRIGEVTRCTFEQNSCVNKGCGGGAMKITRSNLVPALAIVNTTFLGNKAYEKGTSFGAGLNIMKATGDGIRIEGALFENNGPAANGGALRIQDNHITITIEGTHFEGNVGVNGGAIDMLDATIEAIRGCTFVNNAVENHIDGIAYITVSHPLFSRLNIIICLVINITADREKREIISFC